MNALTRYWHNFARYVKHGHAEPLPLESFHPILQEIWSKQEPVVTWADRKAAYAEAKKAHHGQADALANLKKATRSRLVEGIFAHATDPVRIVESHPWLISDPDAFTAAVKATARRRVASFNL